MSNLNNYQGRFASRPLPTYIISFAATLILRCSDLNTVLLTVLLSESVIDVRCVQCKGRIYYSNSMAHFLCTCNCQVICSWNKTPHYVDAESCFFTFIDKFMYQLNSTVLACSNKRKAIFLFWKRYTIHLECMCVYIRFNCFRTGYLLLQQDFYTDIWTM